MWVCRSIEELARVRTRGQRTSVAIGVFDGVHLGHRALLHATLQARPPGGEAVACTFYPHPKSILRPAQAPQAIVSLQTRLALLAETGLDGVLVLPFDAHAAGEPAASFVERVLVDALRAAHVIVGEGFVFGHERSGNVDLLRNQAAAHNFAVHAHPPVLVDGLAMSSTRVRQALQQGQLASVQAWLVSPYRIVGTVVRGDQRGRTLGFPTANVAPDVATLLPYGIYAAQAQMPDGSRWPAAVSIGVHPTFEAARAVKVEAYLLDFAWRDLYGVPLVLHMVSRIRQEQRFSSAQELVTQMHDDVRRVRAALGGA